MLDWMANGYLRRPRDLLEQGNFGLNFKQYDAVRLKKINLPILSAKDEFNLRQPEIGDFACIIEIYSTPPGYELDVVMRMELRSG